MRSAGGLGAATVRGASRREGRESPAERRCGVSACADAVDRLTAALVGGRTRGCALGAGMTRFHRGALAVPTRGNRGVCKKIMGLSIFLLQLRRGGATIMVLIVPSGRGAQRFRNPPKG